MEFDISNSRGYVVWNGKIKILDEKYFIDSYTATENSFKNFSLVQNSQKK